MVLGISQSPAQQQPRMSLELRGGSQLPGRRLSLMLSASDEEYQPRGSVYRPSQQRPSVEEEGAGESEVKRSQWGNRFQFMLATLGYSVGFGNFVRFPYLAMQEGGGAFLIPYVFFLLLAALPLLFLEFAVGQYAGLSVLHVYEMVPLFKGIGWSMIVLSTIIAIYYNLMMTWSIYYLAMSFSYTLPWTTCSNSWNRDICFITTNATNATGARSSAEQFWFFNTLEISSGIEELGGINWKLFGSLAGAWILIYLCLFKGVNSIGKVVYFSAVAPYVALIILAIRGLFLPGATLGLRFFLLPDWSKLANVRIWTVAGTQIFYSIGPGWGGMLTMASYNKFDHKFVRFAIAMPILGALTSLLCGVAVFTVLGQVVYEAGEDSFDIFVRQGLGLAFVAYPQALATLPWPTLWSILFFIMMLTLGLDSEDHSNCDSTTTYHITQFACVEVITTALFDKYPQTLGRHRKKFTVGICFLFFLCGIILTTRGGYYIYAIIDWYGTGLTVALIVFFEAIAFVYFYGVRRLLDNVEEMVGKMRRCSRLTWIAILSGPSVIMSAFICVAIFINFEPLRVFDNVEFPRWSIALGWCLAALSLGQIPLNAIIVLIKYKFNFKKAIQPTENVLACIEERKRQHKLSKLAEGDDD